MKFGSILYYRVSCGRAFTRDWVIPTSHLLASETVPIGTSYSFPVYCICSDATNHSKTAFVSATVLYRYY
jgi:hypothetical protein